MFSWPKRATAASTIAVTSAGTLTSARTGKGIHAVCGDFAHGLFRPVGRRLVVDGDAAATARQFEGDALADAPARAGDDRGLAVERLAC